MRCHVGLSALRAGQSCRHVWLGSTRGDLDLARDDVIDARSVQIHHTPTFAARSMDVHVAMRRDTTTRFFLQLRPMNLTEDHGSSMTVAYRREASGLPAALVLRVLGSPRGAPSSCSASIGALGTDHVGVIFFLRHANAPVVYTLAIIGSRASFACTRWQLSCFVEKRFHRVQSCGILQRFPVRDVSWDAILSQRDFRWELDHAKRRFLSLRQTFEWDRGRSCVARNGRSLVCALLVGWLSNKTKKEKLLYI
jgi:hypothetical protein